MSKEKNHNHIMADNSGFTLVELLVSMAILGVVFIPILRSFMAATLTNSKAQKIQNATSVAQDVMEEIKSREIKELTSGISLKIADDTIKNLSVDGSIKDLNGNEIPATNFQSVAYIHLKGSGVTNTQGETFDVDVAIEAMPYAEAKEESDTSMKVTDANIKKLPMLKQEINTDTCIALSSEINKYDATAVDTLYMRYEEIVDADSTEQQRKRAEFRQAIKDNGTKTVVIDVKDYSDVTKPSEYNCYVKYKVEGIVNEGTVKPDEEVEYLVQSGTVTNSDGSLNLGGPDIYLFYTFMYDANASHEHLNNEKIIVRKNNLGRKHDLNLILNSGSKTTTDIATRLGGDFSVVFEKMNDDGSTESLFNQEKGDPNFGSGILLDGSRFISNVNSVIGGDIDTPLYTNRSKIRLYKVTVKAQQTVMENGAPVLKDKAVVESTMEAK